jgi:ATP-dependent Clp protease ATP-binding subunit ClpC
LKERLRQMFEPFTGQARKVMVLAQEEARRLDQGYIGTEHLLLGLLRYDESLADRTLISLGVTLNEAREQVESMVGRGEGRDVGKAPFTPRSKNVLELALREALRLGHNYVDTDHILLELTNDPNGVAVRALSRLGVDPDEIYREVAGKIGDQETTEQPTTLRGFKVYAGQPGQGACGGATGSCALRCHGRGALCLRLRGWI